MTDIRFDMDSFLNIKKGVSNAESLSELLERESRRYTRELSQESEAGAR